MKIDFERFFCVEKTTFYERIKRSNPNFFDKLESYTRKRYLSNHDNHHRLMQLFLKWLEKHCPHCTIIKDDDLDKIQPTQKDLIFSCGGDGTFLACAQKYTESNLLGINTNYNPEDPIFGSLGALTVINKENFDERLQALMDSRFTIREWKRLGISINNQDVARYAVNDIFIGNQLSYKTCYFSLETQGQVRNHSSSGLIVSTGMGSNAWYRNAGGESFDKDLNAFGYLILSPNLKLTTSASSSILAGDSVLRLRPLNDDVVISFDSTEDLIRTNIDDKIAVFLDNKKPVKVVRF